MIEKYLKVPYAFTIEEWATWKKETKKKHPIVYFLYNDVCRFFRRKITWVERNYWKLQHRYNPKHQYHKLDTGLKAGYHDPSEQIKSAIFHQVNLYIKNNHFVWDEDYKSCDDMIAFHVVDEWAKIYRPRLEQRVRDLYMIRTQVVDYFECGSFTPNDTYKLTQYLEAKIMRIDKKMMMKVICRLDKMWY